MSSHIVFTMPKASFLTLEQDVSKMYHVFDKMIAEHMSKSSLRTSLEYHKRSEMSVTSIDDDTVEVDIWFEVQLFGVEVKSLDIVSVDLVSEMLENKKRRAAEGAALYREYEVESLKNMN